MSKNSRVKVYIPRKLEGKINQYLSSPEIIAVVGARQVGKSTLLRRIYEKITAPKIFLDFEDPEVLSLFNEDIKAFAKLYVENRDFVFLDEFQYVHEGGKKLKFLFDHYNAKILISGSSSLELSFRISSYLVGRLFTFELFPLSFEEFLNFRFPEATELIANYLKERKSFPSVFHRRLMELLNEFVLYGGYPRVVVAESDEEKRIVLKNLLSTYLMKDIMGFFRISSEHPFQKFIRALGIQVGNLLRYSELSSLTGLNLREVKKYLEILEETYIIKLSRPFFSNKRTELAKSPKVYFVDTGFRNYLLKDFSSVFERTDAGFLLENFVASQVMKTGAELKFWRTKSGAEVDFVVEEGRKIWAVEVKAGTKVRPGKSLWSFIRKYKPRKTLIIYSGKLSFERVEDVEIIYLPFYALDFVLGK